MSRWNQRKWVELTSLDLKLIATPTYQAALQDLVITFGIKKRL